jgi:hypothetical protein
MGQLVPVIRAARRDDVPALVEAYERLFAPPGSIQFGWEL